MKAQVSTPCRRGLMSGVAAATWVCLVVRIQLDCHTDPASWTLVIAMQGSRAG